MAKKPKTPPRPRDQSQLAKRIVELTTGEVDDEDSVDPKARKRGEARAESLIPERRSEIAKKAAQARWAKEDKDDGGSDDDAETPAP